VNQRQGNFTRLFELATVYSMRIKRSPRTGRASDDRTREGRLHEAKDRGVDGPASVSGAAVTSGVQVAALPGRGADLYLNGTLWGWLGELDHSVTDAVDLKDAVTARSWTSGCSCATPSWFPPSSVGQFPRSIAT